MCQHTMKTHFLVSRRLIISSLVATLLGGCATPSTRTQTYPGPRKPATETASIANQKNPKTWTGIVDLVDGVKAHDGADVLPGVHTLIVHSDNLGMDMKEVAEAERKLIASGKPATVPQSPLQIAVEETGKTPIVISIEDPRIFEVSGRREAVTRRTLHFTAQAGQSYVVRCDELTGGNLRVEPSK